MITCTFENGGKGNLRHVTADTLVLKEGKILLVKRVGKLLEGGKWGLVGGFVDRNETVIQAAAREVMEETGYTIGGLTLLQILDNPDRPHEDRQNIAFVYYGQAGEKTGQPDDESSEQKWFPLDLLPAREEMAFDHYEDILEYLKISKKS